MAVNPFDDANALFHVLRNSEDQYSIWPVFAEVPSGWVVVLESASRADALSYIDQNWKNITPRSARRRAAKDEP